MKRLYMIGGTMGVGKTTVCQELKRLLPNSVFLDGDWCWDADPFQVTEETMAMVNDNICYLLNSFLRCSAYENVIFCWVMHRQEILDGILARLDTSGCRVVAVSLTASAETLRQRLSADVAAGKRQEDIIARSTERIPLYDALNTVKLSTDGKTPSRLAGELAAL
jgi:predicted kinase